MKKLPIEAVRVRDLVEPMSADRSLVSVDQVASEARLEVRSLERAFARYVGVSPKWVLRRYRLHEAAEVLRGEGPPTLGPTGFNFGPTGFNFGPTGFSFGPAGFSFGPAGFSFGPTGFSFGPTGFSFGPAGFNLGPTGFSFGPTGFSSGPGGASTG